MAVFLTSWDEREPKSTSTFACAWPVIDGPLDAMVLDLKIGFRLTSALMGFKRCNDREEVRVSGTNNIY